MLQNTIKDINFRAFTETFLEFLPEWARRLLVGPNIW